MLSTAERTRLIRRVIDEAIGLGVLEPLLADPSVTEIMVNGPDEVYLERNGRLERADITFTDEGQLYQTIDRIVSQVNRRVDESSPMVDARLPTGERVNVIIPPLALRGPTMTIRRFPRAVHARPADRDGLARHADRRSCCARWSRASSTSSSPAAPAPARRRCSTRCRRPSRPASGSSPSRTTPSCGSSSRTWSRSRRGPSNVEGKGEVSIRDLVRNSLRMRPDRIIVGEVRGAETLDMLQALNTGHEGSLVTVHANSPDDAIHRLETLATMSDLAHPVRGAARPDQLRDPRDRADRPLRRRPPPHRRGRDRRLHPPRDVPARHRRDASRPTRSAPTAASPARFRHFPLPPAIHRRLELMGLNIPAEFGPEAEPRADPRADGASSAEGRARPGAAARA